jgi:ABC-type siderophore export system fused ATPase/permease subunit
VLTDLTGSLLQSWKSLHEARKRLDLGGHRQPFGWLESLTFTDGPGALARQQIRLGALNLIIGANNTGKTTLVNMIAGIGRPDYLTRYAQGGGFSATVRWYDPCRTSWSSRARTAPCVRY